jgi:hypothetical protein
MGTPSHTEDSQSFAEWGVPGRGVETREKRNFGASAPFANPPNGNERLTSAFSIFSVKLGVASVKLGVPIRIQA